MGIFSRVRDIISSNLNAMLDKAEDPEKLVRLMIQEMEDTLVEIKASCAGAMAAKKRVGRQLDEVASKVELWASRAKTAVEKGREELAREALLEKRRFNERVEVLQNETSRCEDLIEQYQNDIVQLEEKLTSARNKHRILVQRHIHATGHQRAQKGIRKADTSDAFIRFEKFESRIDRMEADGDLVNYGVKPSLEDEIDNLSGDEELEKELSELKADVEKK